MLALQGVASTRRATEGDTGQTTRIYTWNEEFGRAPATHTNQETRHSVEAPVWMDGVPLERPEDWIAAGRHDARTRNITSERETNRKQEPPESESWQPRNWPAEGKACNIVLKVKAGEGAWRTWAVLGLVMDELCAEKGINSNYDAKETWGMFGVEQVSASQLNEHDQRRQIGEIRSQWGQRQEDEGGIRTANDLVRAAHSGWRQQQQQQQQQQQRRWRRRRQQQRDHTGCSGTSTRPRRRAF